MQQETSKAPFYRCVLEDAQAARTCVCMPAWLRLSPACRKMSQPKQQRTRVAHASALLNKMITHQLNATIFEVYSCACMSSVSVWQCVSLCAVLGTKDRDKSYSQNAECHQSDTSSVTRLPVQMIVADEQKNLIWPHETT